MDDLYDFLVTMYDYDKIHIKNKYIMVDMGFIGNNSYHVEITDTTTTFYDLNGRAVATHDYQDTDQLSDILTTFTEGATKTPTAGDDDIDNITMDEIMSKINLPDRKTDKIKIYTFGKSTFNPAHIKVDRFYDLSKYRSNIPNTFGSLRYLTGKDEVVQKFVALGIEFESTLIKIINDIERNNLRTIGIFCSHGKHRSVSFGEILKYYVYRRSILNHLCIK